MAKRYVPQAARLDTAIGTLQQVVRWKFATDGRKFSGNHKEVLKSVIEMCEETLKDLGFKPRPIRTKLE